MKKILLGLSATLLVVMSTSANANNLGIRLKQCVNEKRDLKISFDRVQAELTQCRLSNVPGNGNGQCRNRLRDLRERLRQCELNSYPTPIPTPDYGETARLRRELQEAREELRLARDDNRFLRETNDSLRVRLDECEGQNPPYPNNNGYFCTAACTKSDRSTPDLRYLGGAEAMFELQAQDLASQNLRQRFNCSWGVTNVSCGQQGFENQNYCIAGCAKSDRTTVDMRYTKGAAGRSSVEAEFNAIQEVNKAYNCSWGVAVSNCN